MAERRQFCTFFLDGQRFGVDVLKVQEVIPYQEMTRVPLALPTVRGLINLRGQIVTAIDLRRGWLPERPRRRPADERRPAATTARQLAGGRDRRRGRGRRRRLGTAPRDPAGPRAATSSGVCTLAGWPAPHPRYRESSSTFNRRLEVPASAEMEGGGQKPQPRRSRVPRRCQAPRKPHERPASHAAVRPRDGGGTAIRLVVEAAPIAFVGHRHEGTIRLVNAQSEKLFGYRRGSARPAGRDARAAAASGPTTPATARASSPTREAR